MLDISIIFKIKKSNYTTNLFLCLHFIIISFRVFSKFQTFYFNIHIFLSKQKLHVPYKMFAEEDLLMIFQFIIGANPISFPGEYIS